MSMITTRLVLAASVLAASGFGALAQSSPAATPGQNPGAANAPVNAAGVGGASTTSGIGSLTTETKPPGTPPSVTRSAAPSASGLNTGPTSNTPNPCAPGQKNSSSAANAC